MEIQRKAIARAIIVVFVFNLVMMGAGARFAYQKAPPIPDEVAGPDDDVVANGDAIREGKTMFQRDGLMNHGSILGNGAYYGANYTANALSLKVGFMRNCYAQERYDEPYDELDSADQAAIADVVKSDLDDSYGDGVIRYTMTEVYTRGQVRQEYVERYHGGNHECGVPVNMIDSEGETRTSTDFAMRTA